MQAEGNSKTVTQIVETATQKVDGWAYRLINTPLEEETALTALKSWDLIALPHLPTSFWRKVIKLREKSFILNLNQEESW